MKDTQTAATAIHGATVILSDQMIETDLVMNEDRIVDLEPSAPADHEIDARGLILAPALIDVNGDAFERHLMPRPGVFFPLETAILDTERQLAANGIATVYHALTLGWELGLRAVDRGHAFDVPIQDRAFEQSEAFRIADLDDPRIPERHAKNAQRSGIEGDAYLELLTSIWARRPEIDATIRKIADRARGCRCADAEP